MAKKKPNKMDQPEIKLDDLDFNFDLDVEDPMVKDDRHPAIRVAEGMKEGVKDYVVSKDFVKTAIKKIFPPGFGEAIDLGDEISESARKLYDDSVREMRPALNQAKQTAAKLIPPDSKLLPKSVKNLLESWRNENRNIPPDQGREAVMATTLQQMFSAQETAKAQDKAKSDGESKLAEGIRTLRYRTTLEALNRTAISVSQLAEYQNRIGSSVEKKSLELQYRQYFVQQDTLEFLRQDARRRDEILLAISKNTSLPEFVKINHSEVQKQIAKNKLHEAMYDGLFGGRNQYITKTLKGISDSVSSTLRETAESLSFAASSALMGKDMAESMGVPLDGYKMGGNAGVGMLLPLIAEHYLGKAGDKLAGSKLDKRFGVSNKAHWLSRYTNSLPNHLNRFRKSNKYMWDDSLKGTFMGALQDLLPSFGIDTRMKVSNSGNMYEPYMFTRRSDKSINEVIPGYLARIFRELQVLRTGDNKLGLTAYSYQSNKFLDQKAIMKETRDKIFQPGHAGYLHEDLDRIIQQVDPENKLSPEARKELKFAILRSSANKDVGDAETFTDKSKYSAETAEELSNHMSNFFKSSSEEQKKKFEIGHNNVARNIPDIRNVIQTELDNGNIEQLRKLGILDESRGGVDLDTDAIIRGFLDANPNYDREPDKPNRLADFIKTAAKTGAETVSQTYKDISSSVMQTAENVKEAVVDIYVNGEKSPRILEIKMKAGDYYDKTSEKVITTYSDIKGEVIDLTTKQTVITKDNVEHLVKKTETGFQSLRLTASNLSGSFSKSVRDFMNTQTGMKLSDSFSTASSMVKAMTGNDSPSDVYVEGEQEPRMTGIGMKNGEYFDKETGNPIKSVNDIAGVVVDKDQQTVLTDKDIPKVRIYNWRLRRWSPLWIGAKIAKFIYKASTWWTFKKAPGITKALLKAEWSIAKAVGRGALSVLGLTRKAANIDITPVDVYVKGSGDVKLYGRYFKLGKYFSASTKEVIKTPTDIDGPVVDEAGETLLTQEDIDNGLVDVNGKSLDFARMRRELLKKKPTGKLRQMSARNLGRLFSFGKKTISTISKAMGISYGEAASVKSSDTLEDIKSMFKKFMDKQDSKEIKANSYMDRIKTDEEKTKAEEKKSEEDPDKKGKSKSLAKRIMESKLAEKTKGLMSKAGTSIMDGLGTIGSSIAGSAAGAAIGGAATTAAGALGAGASAVGGALMSGLGVAGAIAMQGLGVLGAIISSPVVIGAAALAAMTYAGYRTYKYFKTKLDDKDKMRMAQYGFDPENDKDDIEHLLDLEQYLKPFIVENKDGYTLETKRMNAQALMATFELDNNNAEHRTLFYGWLHNRFKPVLFSHLAALKATTGKGDLNDIDKLKGAQLQKYLKLAYFPEGPYSYDSLPVTKKVNIAGYKLVETYYKTAMAEAEKEAAAEKNKKPSKLAEMAGVKSATAKTLDSAEDDKKKDKAIQDKALSAKITSDKSGAQVLKDGGKIPDDEKDSSSPEDSSDNDKKKVIGGYDVSKLVLAAGPLDPGKDGEQYVTPERNANISDLNSEMKTKLFGMAKEYHDLTGKTLPVNAGARTFKDQVRLRKRFGKGRAAAPGESLHEYGLAVDIDSKVVNELERLGLMRKYGFTRPVSGEPWHMEPIGIQSNLENYKTNPEEIDDAIKAGVSKGGGGVGSVTGLGKSHRNAKVSEAIMAAKVEPGLKTAKAETIKKTAPEPTTIKEAGASILTTTDGKPVTSGSGEVITTGSAPSRKAINDIERKIEASQDSGEKKPMSIAQATSQPLPPAKENAPQVPRRTPAVTSSESGGGVKTPGEIPSSKQEIVSIIKDAARTVGVDENILISQAAMESDMNPNAQSGTSTAKGLFQFTNGTWADTVKKYGQMYGVTPDTSPMDPKAASLMAAIFLKNNLTYLNNKLRGGVGPTEAYLAHFLGAGGAASFLFRMKRTPEAIGAEVLPDAAQANRSIFYDQTGNPRTLKQIYDLLANRVQSKASAYGVTLPSSSDVVANPGGPGPDKAENTTFPRATQQELPRRPPRSSVEVTTGPQTEPIASVPGGQMPRRLPAVRPTMTPTPSMMPGMEDVYGFNRNMSTQVQVAPSLPNNIPQDLMKDTNGILSEQLAVQKNILDIVKGIANKSSSGESAGQTKPGTSEQTDKTPGYQYETPRAAISMRRGNPQPVNS